MMLLEPGRIESKLMLRNMRILLGQWGASQLLGIAPETLRKGCTAGLASCSTLRTLQVIHAMFFDPRQFLDLLTVVTCGKEERIIEAHFRWEGRQGFCDGSGI